MKRRPIIVAAVGCAMASDDAIGLHLASSLDDGTALSENEHDLTVPGPLDIRFWEDADSLSVAQEFLDLDQPLFLIDCADMGLPGGQARTFDADTLRCRSSSVSCHGFGLAEAIELASCLGFNAPLRIFGVQPFDCSPSGQLSAEMLACYERVLFRMQSGPQSISPGVGVMCLAVPMKILTVESLSHRTVGKVDLDGSVYDIDLSLIDSPQQGDFVIVHAGIAIEKLDRVEADQRLALFDRLANLYRQELGQDVQLIAQPERLGSSNTPEPMGSP